MEVDLTADKAGLEKQRQSLLMDRTGATHQLTALEEQMKAEGEAQVAEESKSRLYDLRSALRRVGFDKKAVDAVKAELVSVGWEVKFKTDVPSTSVYSKDAVVSVPPNKKLKSMLRDKEAMEADRQATEKQLMAIQRELQTRGREEGSNAVH